MLFSEEEKKQNIVKKGGEKGLLLVVAEPDREAFGVKAREVLLRRRVGDVGPLPQALDADLAELGRGRVGVEALPRVEGHGRGREQVERVLGLGGGGGGRGVVGVSGSGGSGGRRRRRFRGLGGLLGGVGVVDRGLVGQRDVAQDLGEGRVVDQGVEPASGVGDRRAVRRVKKLGEAQPEVADADDVGERDVVSHEVGPGGEHRVEGGQGLLDGSLRRCLFLLGVGPDAGDGQVPGEQGGVDLSRGPVDCGDDGIGKEGKREK